MSYAVKTLTPADADTVEAALWYDAQSPGLGAEFMEEVSEKQDALSPQRGLAFGQQAD